MSLDPLVRRSPTTVRCIVASLATVLGVLGEGGRATRLRLKPPKCVAIPNGSQLSDFKSFLRPVPGADGIQVADRSAFHRVFVGTAAGEEQGRAGGAKLRTREADVRAWRSLASVARAVRWRRRASRASSAPSSFLTGSGSDRRGAWCTAARFGNPPAPCPLRCGVHSGDRQTHLLFCPALLRWLDLHLYHAASPPDASVAGYVRRLGAPFPANMRSAMSLDIAIWATDQIRYGATVAPPSLFSVRLKELFCATPTVDAPRRRRWLHLPLRCLVRPCGSKSSRCIGCELCLVLFSGWVLLVRSVRETYTDTYTFICTRSHAATEQNRTHMYIYIYTHARTHTHSHMHIHVWTCISAYIHSRTDSHNK